MTAFARFHHPPSGRVEQAPPGGTLGEGDVSLSRTLLSACSRFLLYGQAKPASPSPVTAVGKQQLLTLLEAGCCNANPARGRAAMKEVAA